MSNIGHEKLVLRSENKTATIKINPRILCNQMSSVINAATSGAGMAVVPSYLVREQVKKGTLVRILPLWHGPKLPVSIVSPIAMGASSRLSLLTNEIISECRKVF